MTKALSWYNMETFTSISYIQSSPQRSPHSVHTRLAFDPVLETSLDCKLRWKDAQSAINKITRNPHGCFPAVLTYLRPLSSDGLAMVAAATETYKSGSAKMLQIGNIFFPGAQGDQGSTPP